MKMRGENMIRGRRGEISWIPFDFRHILTTGKAGFMEKMKRGRKGMGDEGWIGCTCVTYHSIPSDGILVSAANEAGFIETHSSGRL